MIRDWWGLLLDTVNRWLEHKDARLGAALAYYSIFSLGPVIVIAIAIAGRDAPSSQAPRLAA
jgi:membrane protein